MIGSTALAFDLDGTLIDSRRDLATAVNRVRVELGHEKLAVEVVRGMVGEGVRVLLERALPDLPPTQFEDALESYLRHYEQVCLDSTFAYPGIPHLLSLAADRLPLAVLTNKPESMSRRILDHLGLLPHFKVVIGGDTLPVRKPEPETIAAVAQKLAVRVSTLTLIGDSLTDAATAKAAASGLILVSWGFRPRSELETTGAPICDSVPELAARLGLS
ncbi:MAG: HAD-IA family hydrolase [Acidobacteriota bacterium]